MKQRYTNPQLRGLVTLKLQQRPRMSVSFDGGQAPGGADAPPTELPTITNATGGGPLNPPLDAKLNRECGNSSWNC